MKNVVMSIIILMLMGLNCFPLQAQQASSEMSNTRYVCAYNGINLRASADRNAEIITKLEHATEVEILEVLSEQFEIDYRKSSWVKVESDTYTGYLFGGYLVSVEPIDLEPYAFDCNTDMYYLDWVSDVIGESKVIRHQMESTTKNRLGRDIEMPTYKTFLSGDVFYNKVGPQTDSYYFESSKLSYNDVLNFMEYMVACQNRFCNSDEFKEKAIFRPIKNMYGQLVRVDCTTPLSMTAHQRGDKMIVKLETCL